jgi:hypothetical protein
VNVSSKTSIFSKLSISYVVDRVWFGVGVSSCFVLSSNVNF